MTLEDSQRKETDPEREQIIAEMLRNAESTKTELPSELTKNPVLNPECNIVPRLVLGDQVYRLQVNPRRRKSEDDTASIVLIQLQSKI